MDLYQVFIRFYVGSYRTCSHMSLVTENGITNIVEVRNLNTIK